MRINFFLAGAKAQNAGSARRQAESEFLNLDAQFFRHPKMPHLVDEDKDW